VGLSGIRVGFTLDLGGNSYGLGVVVLFWDGHKKVSPTRHESGLIVINVKFIPLNKKAMYVSKLFCILHIQKSNFNESCYQYFKLLARIKFIQ
jgi:hypothetical protein